MKVAIIGAGLAGTALAYVLKRAGAESIIYEAEDEIAPGASGNDIGLINPRLSAFRTPESDYYTSAFGLAVRTFDAMSGINWKRCGSLHFMNSEQKAKRFPQTLGNWGWPEEHMRMLSAEEASTFAGVRVAQDALYLPDSGYISPRKICMAYADGVEVKFGARVESLSEIDSDVVVIACGMGALGFEEAAFLPLQGVRGQVTQIHCEALSGLKANLCYGGYCSPALDGVHTVGATFQRWLDHSELMPEDDAANIEGLRDLLPFDLGEVDVAGQRASVRCTTKDHFPIVGALPDTSNVYVSCGHGSHGVISSLAGAHLLADMILDRPRSLARATIHCLAPKRFV